MLRVDPRDFCKLFSILFCKAVPGEGGTFCGVFKDKDSNLRGWGRGGDENKVSAAPSRSACEPAKDSSSSPMRSRYFPSVPTSIFYFSMLIRRKILADLTRALVGDTEVIPFPGFSASRAVVVQIKRKTKMSAFRRPRFCTSLVGRHN